MQHIPLGGLSTERAYAVIDSLLDNLHIEHDEFIAPMILNALHADGSILCYKYEAGNTKPPIGILPKAIHNSKRYTEVCEAIVRYYQAGMPIPIVWVEEHNELLNFERERSKKINT